MQVNFDPRESKRKGISFCGDSPWILHRAASSAFRANRRRFLLAAAVKVTMVWRTARAARSGQWRPAARHGPFAPSASSSSQGRCFASLLRRASSESAKWQVCPLRSPHLESSSGRSLLGAACPNEMLLRPMRCSRRSREARRRKFASARTLARREACRGGSAANGGSQRSMPVSDATRAPFASSDKLERMLRH